MVGKTPVAQRPKQLKISAKDRKIERETERNRNTNFKRNNLNEIDIVRLQVATTVTIAATRRELLRLREEVWSR